MPETATPSPPTAAVAPRSRWRRVARFFVVVGICCLILFGWYYWRGTAVTSVPRDPKTAQEGAICQLVKGADGGVDIRTSAIIPVPIETAWSILSNYEEWEKLFKTVRRKQVAEELDENHHHVVSDVWTPMGMLSLDFIVTHEKTPQGGYIARWDAPVPELPINRGTIEISPLAGDQTLFVYTVRKQYKHYPQFFVNNSLLDHQPDLIDTLRKRMIEVAKTP